MIRFALPVAGGVVFFVLSLATVRLARPRVPRLVFLVYGALSVVAVGAAYLRFWPIARPDDVLGLLACVLFQTLICLTVWNVFYSVLWGFSGGLCHDLLTDARVRQLDRLVSSYDREDGLDRILARRVPNLVAGAYLDYDGESLQLRPKGHLIARATLVAFRLFSLGMGGGLK